MLTFFGLGIKFSPFLSRDSLHVLIEFWFAVVVGWFYLHRRRHTYIMLGFMPIPVSVLIVSTGLLRLCLLDELLAMLITLVC